MKTIYVGAFLCLLLVGLNPQAQINEVTSTSGGNAPAIAQSPAEAAVLEAASNAVQAATIILLPDQAVPADLGAPAGVQSSVVLTDAAATAGVLIQEASSNGQTTVRFVFQTSPATLAPTTSMALGAAQTLNSPQPMDSLGGCVRAGSGLLGWWQAEGNANDSAGSNNGQTPNDIAYVAGEVGQAFNFNGVNQSVQIPCLSWMAPASFSVEAWVNPAHQIGWQAFVFGQGYGRQLVVRAGAVGVNVAFYVTDLNGSFYGVTSSREIPIGQWTHLAGTWNGTNLKLFLNGVQDRNASLQLSAIGNSGCPFSIGGANNSCGSSGQYFPGWIDEVSYYNRALFAGEIYAIYQAGSAGKCKTPPDCAACPASVVSWWPAEGNASDVVGSSSGTPQNGSSYAPGLVGQAFSFNGVNQSVETPHPPGSLSAVFSVEAWVNPTYQPAGQAFIFGQAYGRQLVARPGIRGLGIAWAISRDYWTFYESDSNGEIPLNEWTHLVGTWDGASLKLYVNGALDQQAGLSVNAWDSNCGFSIGGGNSPCGVPSQYFHGYIDEPTYYNQALSAADVQAIYNAGSAGKCLPYPPTITSQPAGQTAIQGANVSFCVTATGTAPLSYQWRFNGTSIAGATGSCCTIASVQPANAGNYAVLVSNPAGSVTSGNAALTVLIPPSITAQPAGQTVMEGSVAAFSVVAGGSAPLAYQWTLNGQNIPGATASSFTTEGLEVSGSGHIYAVGVANAAGAVTSPGATLTVLPCDPTSRPLTVNAWKTSCEDKFYFDVHNLTGAALTGGQFDLFVYYDGVTRTLYRNLQPWVATDALPNGGNHMFTFCSPDHSITNFDCTIVYRGGGSCAASPKFRIATRENLALVMANTTQIANPRKECDPLAVPDYVLPRGRPWEDTVHGVFNCAPDPCGFWTNPLPASSSASGAAQRVDNFYKASGPPEYANPACPKSGFKNVYAIKQWHGAWGPLSPMWGRFSAMRGDGSCQTPAPPQNTPDSTKYLTLSASSTATCVWFYGGHGGGWSAESTSSCSVDQFSGKSVGNGSDTDSDGLGINSARAWLGHAHDNVGTLIGLYVELLGWSEANPGATTYSGQSATPSASADYVDESTGTHHVWSVTLDLVGGSLDATYEETPAEGRPGDVNTRSITARLGNDSVYYQETRHSQGGSGEARDEVNNTYEVHATFSQPYTSTSVNADCDALLAQWNLLDDIEYPWRSDGGITSGPLVTYNECPATAPSIVSEGFQSADPRPWPSQSEGAVLGAPLPVHGPGGELYAYQPYFNFYHVNWNFIETDRGHPEPFVKSHGASSPFANATQWIDDLQARVLPGGPFWAYGSEAEDNNHLMFRLKDPYLTDTDDEWEQGGLGGGCLIKCKWAETLTSPALPGNDLVFKDWKFDFRDFMESYGCNAGAWYRQYYETACPGQAYCTPVRYTPAIFPSGQPGAGYYIDPSRGSWWISEMHCQPLHYDYTCCQPAIYVQPNSPGADCTNGIYVAMPPAVCDGQYGSLWMGRVDQSTADTHACDNYIANRNNGIANSPSCDPQIELDLLWHDTAHTYETFVAPLGFSYGGTPPQRLTLDLDIDSDNNNGFNPPDRSAYEDAIEDNPTLPGKIVYVNAGDADSDGIPDFADGFDLSGVAGNADETAGPNHFVPLVLEIPSNVNLSAARLTINYDASDPAGVTQGEDGKWYPASGHLRIWRKDGDQSRNLKSANASQNPGDYVAPGRYTLGRLGFSESCRLITYYVEGIAASAYRADQRITVLLDPTGDGESPPLQDAVRVTVIGVEVVEALNDYYVETLSGPLQDSHPAPYFENLAVNPIGDPQPSADGTRLLNSIQISGRIRSDLCDLVPGANGKIGANNGGLLQDISFSLNGEPLANGTIYTFNQPKATGDPSFTRPYATYTEFNIVFTDVDVSTGLNWLRLAATDKVPGVGLTGFAEYSWTVTATIITAASSSRQTTEPQSPCDGPYSGWTFQNSPPTLISASQGGETHAYYVRLVGPSDVLASRAAEHPDKVAQGPDLLYYIANSLHIPEVHALVQLTKIRALPPQDPIGLLTEQAGFFYGMGAQAVDDVTGLAKLTFYINQLPEWEQRYLMACQAVDFGMANDQQCQLVIEVGTKAEELSAAAQTAWHLWEAVERSEWNTLTAAASGEWHEAWAQSETCRWLAAYMVEAMVAINNHYVSLSPFERGKLQGRITLEAVLIILPFTKAAEAGQASKLLALTKLTEVSWIKENEELLAVLNEVIDLLIKRPPVIPTGKIGDATERIMAAAELEIRNGAPVADTYLKYMSELVPNAGEFSVAKRVGSFAEAMVQRLPENPGAADMQSVASVRQVRNLLVTKGAQELAVADEHSSLDIIYDLTVPSGKPQIHHSAPEHVIERLQQLGHSGLDIDGCPAMVLDQIDHAGLQPYTAQSLHAEMDAWNNGVLRWDKVRVNNDDEELVNQIILFHQSKCPGWEKAMRGWANVNGLPHTE